MVVRCLLLLLVILIVVFATPWRASSQHSSLRRDLNDHLLVAQSSYAGDFYRIDRATVIHSDQQPEPKEIFLLVIDMINRFYVSPVSIKSLLESVWKHLQLVLLPAFVDEDYVFEECHSSAEKCFLDSLDSLCRSRNIDCDYLINESTRLLVKGLDANSSLLDKGMLNELKISMSGTFGGVGMVVASKDGRYVVVASIDGSPAQKAGIKAGDEIREIDGNSLQGLPLTKVLSMVRGPSGSLMTVVVESSRSNKARQLKLRRKIIKIAPVRSIMLSQRVGYLRIVNFQENTSDELIRAVSRLLNHSNRPLKGIIVDVRDNPGGLFEEAIKTAGLFKARGKLTYLKGRSLEMTTAFYSPRHESIYDGPIVILANKGSASGSEVLIGALQGMRNVLVIGERTFGKASVQGVFPLTTGLALRLTTAHYYTADGRDIDGKGIDPDIIFEQNEHPSSLRVGAVKADDIQDDPVVSIALAYILHERLPKRSPFTSIF